MGTWQRVFALSLALGLVYLSAPSAVSAQILAGPFIHDTLYVAEYASAPITPRGLALGKRSSARTATIRYTFEGNVPAETREAFEFAAGIWESHLQSAIPIDVRVKWEDLGENVLGTAGPRLVANWRGALSTDTWFPTALAESMANQNFTETNADIEATFNSGFPDWYFGLDGNVPRDKYDFVSVVVHELGHGLGFTGSFDIEDGDDDETSQDCPNTDTAGLGCWGLPTNAGVLFPFIFDRFTEDADEVSLLNTGTYPNPSEALAAVLQSGQVFFDGPLSTPGPSEVPIALYAPSTYEAGSSFSHLDEGIFNDTPSALMTPKLANGEVTWSPGPVTCGLMRNLGWALGPDCLFLLGTDELDEGQLFSLSGFSPNPSSDVVRATLMVDRQQTVRIEIYDVTGRQVGTIQELSAQAQQPYVITVQPGELWSSGVYFVRVMGETFNETQSVVYVR